MLNHPEWSVAPDRSPFIYGKHSRPLGLVLDDVSVDATPAVALLEAFGNRDSAHLYSTDSPRSGGRVTLRDPVRDGYVIPAELEDPSGSVVVGIPAAGSLHNQATLMAQEHPGTDAGALERVLQLMNLSRTCDLLDGLVLGERVIQQPALKGNFRAEILTPEQAVALLGLNLRAHGDFVVSRDATTTYFLGAESFYRAVTFSHIEPLAVWLPAAASAWHAGNERPSALVDGVATRTGRALRARDYLQVRMRAADFHAVWDEVLFFFDVVLIHVMGAFDLLARLLHDVYGLDGLARHASWRADKWLKKLRHADAELGVRASPGGSLSDVIYLVAELRNFVHDAPLSQEIRKAQGIPEIMSWGRGLVALTPDDRVQEMIRAASRHGGLLAWGISDRTSDGAVLLDPGRFAEQALRASTTAISDLLATADLERLPGAGGSTAATWIPEPTYRENSRLLFGLQPGGLREERLTAA